MPLRFDRISYEDVPVLRVDFSAALKGYFSNRIGGFSKPPYDSMNLAVHVGDDADTVLRNKKKIQRALNFDKDFFMVNQVHGNDVLIVDEKILNANVSSQQNHLKFDSMITAIPEIPLMMFFADCVPVIIADVKENVIAVVHAGWQGTYKKVVQFAVSRMIENFGSKVENLKAAIGPSIKDCCYEIDENLVNKFQTYSGAIVEGNHKYFLNLSRVNSEQLELIGLKTENIVVSDLCTFSDNEFFSYRRDIGKTGRQAAIAFIENT